VRTDRPSATAATPSQVLSAVAPGSVDSAFISPGAEPQEREANAKYALSVARKKLGVTFALWQDITEVGRE
jgi:hypothetical protein